MKDETKSFSKIQRLHNRKPHHPCQGTREFQNHIICLHQNLTEKLTPILITSGIKGTTLSATITKNKTQGSTWQSFLTVEVQRRYV